MALDRLKDELLFIASELKSTGHRLRWMHLGPDVYDIGEGLERLAKRVEELRAERSAEHGK